MFRRGGDLKIAKANHFLDIQIEKKRKRIQEKMGESDRRKLAKPIGKASPITIEDESPIRAIVCLKRSEDIKRFELSEDCFILDFDPSESVDLAKLSLEKKKPSDEDLSVIAEKGKVHHQFAQIPFLKFLSLYSLS